MAIKLTFQVNNVLDTGALDVTVTATDGTHTVTDSIITEEFAQMTTTEIREKLRDEILPAYRTRLEAYKRAQALAGLKVEVSG